MPYTDAAKLVAQDGPGVFGATRYVSLHLASGTELSGHGYSRAAVAPADVSVAADGDATLPANLEIYTADDDSAQVAASANIYDAATGGNAYLDAPGELDAPLPGAPADGQALQVSLTVTA